MNSAVSAPKPRQAVLFLCHHNAVRSQMAEALLRARFPNRYEVASAGTAPSDVHPLAIRVLEEIGVSTVGLRSKHVREFIGRSFDIVATVCAQDEPSCPFFPGGRQLHHAFDDPTIATGPEEDRVAAFRRSRDAIDAWIRSIFEREVAPAPGRAAMPWKQAPLASLLDAGNAAIDAALGEDSTSADATSLATLHPEATITAVVRAKAAGALAGHVPA